MQLFYSVVKGNMNNIMNITFNAEIKRTTQKKMASLDNIYELVLNTDNPELLELGKLPSDTLVNVTVEVV